MLIFILRKSKTRSSQDEVIIAHLLAERVEKVNSIINKTEVHASNGKTFGFMDLAFIDITCRAPHRRFYNIQIEQKLDIPKHFNAPLSAFKDRFFLRAKVVARKEKKQANYDFHKLILPQCCLLGRIVECYGLLWKYDDIIHIAINAENKQNFHKKDPIQPDKFPTQPQLQLPPLCPVWLGFVQKQIRYMTNLLVTTNNPDERIRLEEQFPLEDHFFRVPKNEACTLEAIFRSISFEYFQNSPPQIIQKLIAFAENAVNSIISLDLLRKIIALVKIQRDNLALYHKYFTEINREIGDCDERGGLIIEGMEEGLPQESDKLFDIANRGEMRLTRTLDCYDIQEEFDMKIKTHCPLAISQKTQLPSISGTNPEEMQAEEDSKPSYIIGSAQHYYGLDNQWWKQQKHSNDSSKQISRFDCKAGNPLLQKSIGKLVVQEFRYDLNREIELARDINKHQEVEGFKYKKMMKDKLLSAKLKKRRKK